MISHKEMIKQDFRFLVDEYGFSVHRENYSPEIMGNTEVVFISDTTGIRIVIDRSQVFVNIGEISWAEEDWFELSDIVHFFDPNLDQVYVFSQEWKNSREAIKIQIDRLANIIHQYCKPLLEGDFSSATQIKEIEKKRITDMLEHFKNLPHDKTK